MVLAAFLCVLLLVIIVGGGLSCYRCLRRRSTPRGPDAMGPESEEQ